MEAQMITVVSSLSDLFLLKPYWSIADNYASVTTEEIKFIMEPGYSNIKDAHFPSLMALVAIEQAKIVFIDGYHQNLFYRCQRLFVEMLRYLLPDKLVMELIRSRVTYRRIETENEQTNSKIEIIEDAKNLGYDTLDLSIVTWETYSQELFPDLYTMTEVYKNELN